jgi:ribose-phosphate pyrophosphokinase
MGPKPYFLSNQKSLKETFMNLTLLSGRSNPALAQALAAELGLSPVPVGILDFPDGELKVRIEEKIEGHDVYVAQSTGPPAAENLLELMLIADAARRSGAARVTGIIPYFGYSRHDRRTAEGEPLGGKLIADILSTRLDRMIVLDLHNPAVEGFFGIPVVSLSAVPLLSDALRPKLEAQSVLVAADLGAAKLVQKYAKLLDLPVAYLHKTRVSGEDVNVLGITGRVKGMFPVLVDDMISTGGTLFSAVEALLENGARPGITIAATHALFVGQAKARFAGLPLRRILVTDSLPRPDARDLPIQVVEIGRMLADAIRRLRR